MTMRFDVVWDVINRICEADRPPVGVMRWSLVPFDMDLSKSEIKLIEHFSRSYLNLIWSVTYPWPHEPRPIPEGYFGLIREYSDSKAGIEDTKGLSLQQVGIVQSLRDKIYSEGSSLVRSNHDLFLTSPPPRKTFICPIIVPEYCRLNPLESGFLQLWVWYDQRFSFHTLSHVLYLSHWDEKGRQSYF